MACAPGNRALDTCASLPGEQVAAAIGSRLTSQALDGVRDSETEKSSACDYAFANGDSARVVLFDHSSGDDTHRPANRSVNEPMTSALGYPVYHDDGESQYDVFPSDTKEVIIRLFHDSGKVTLGASASDGTVAVGTFDHAPVQNKNDKAIAIARLVKF